MWPFKVSLEIFRSLPLCASLSFWPSFSLFSHNFHSTATTSLEYLSVRWAHHTMNEHCVKLANGVSYTFRIGKRETPFCRVTTEWMRNFFLCLFRLPNHWPSLDAAKDKGAKEEREGARESEREKKILWNWKLPLIHTIYWAFSTQLRIENCCRIVLVLSNILTDVDR